MKRDWILCLCVILFCAYSCATPGKSYEKALAKAPFDVIIVPGIPYQGDDWTKNPYLKDRILWSYFLYTRGIAENVIYSGNAVYTPYVEGKIMAMYAVKLGIPQTHIFSETRAEHSTENLVYGYRLAKKMGFVKIAVATDPFQTNTLRSYAWNYGIPVTFIPVIFDSLRLLQADSSIRIDPSEASVRDFVPLPQKENPIRRFLGTMGLEIKNDSGE